AARKSYFTQTATRDRPSSRWRLRLNGTIGNGHGHSRSNLRVWVSLLCLGGILVTLWSQQAPPPQYDQEAEAFERLQRALGEHRLLQARLSGVSAYAPWSKAPTLD